MGIEQMFDFHSYVKYDFRQHVATGLHLFYSSLGQSYDEIYAWSGRLFESPFPKLANVELGPAQLEIFHYWHVYVQEKKHPGGDICSDCQIDP